MSTSSPRFIGVTGLPRAGSTLVCQLLAQHPDVHSEVHTSPLCNALLGLRRMISDDSFFLAQLDNSFEQSYGHLTSAMRGFLRGWYEGAAGLAVVDKNRAWLHCIEMLLKIEADAKLVVCIRELGQIYGSIEARHQSTILVDFIDHLADFDRFGRADALFAKDKAIGAPLVSLHAVADLPAPVQDRLYVVRLEDLTSRPVACMSHLYAWLGLPDFRIDADHLAISAQESDSHYHMKYSHAQASSIRPQTVHAIPPRVQSLIEAVHPWFYSAYY
ncbi:sulfotransferase family protein, partial [Rubrivivax gelatinosus]|nr:sulfotransferase family protein [Rubrivivax gelatinosus]